MTMDPLAATILSRCDPQHFKTLGALTRSAMGLPRKAVVPSRTRRGAGIYPFLSETPCTRYYIKYGATFPVDMAGREKQALFFQREPRVVVERAMRNDRFCAAYLEDRMAVGRQFLVITSRSMHVDAMFLLGLLGSRLHAFLYRNYFHIAYSGERRKITLQHLRKLPIPIRQPVERGLIIGLVMQVLNARAASPGADTTALEAQIDERVYRMFGLDPAEVLQLEGRLAGEADLFKELRDRAASVSGEALGAEGVMEE
jgi:hypothetical protein